MSLKVHYLMTLFSLILLGVLLLRPNALLIVQKEGRVCKLYRAKVDCVVKYQNRIRPVTEVNYSMN